MFLKDYDLFIFDWDGTLTTSKGLVRVSAYLKRRYNMDYINSHKQLYTMGSNRSIESKKGISRIYAAVYDFYSMFSMPSLKPHALDLLAELKRNKKKVAIFSDANRHRLYLETRRLGVLDHADMILSADSIKEFKPNPTGIAAILKNFRVKKGRCLYIGDMVVDIFTARFAGVDSCGVSDGVEPKELLKKVKPDYIVDSLESLRKRL